jgi:mono/diheme cytochrome c family protein
MKTLPLLVAASLLYPLAARAGDVRGNPQSGKSVFTQNCQMCHGSEGKGDGPAAAGLNPKPANFSDPARKDFTYERQIKVVKAGGPTEKLSPLMPPFGESLTEQQIRDVVTYVRDTFLPKEISQR